MRHYALKGFLRAIPNEMLSEYFNRDGLLTYFDFNEIKPTNIEPIFAAIQQLPANIRAAIDTDFQDIFALSYSTGIKLILDESRYHSVDLLEIFVSLKGNYAKAFWIFLNNKDVFDSVLLLSCRDNVAGTWRKRRGLPVSTGIDFSSKKEQFAMAIAQNFRNEGRGRECVVDYKNRGNLHYFFAYPEDYSQSYIHYDNGVMKRDSHNPAFQVIFIYDTEQGTLDIYHEGSKASVEQLRIIFAKEILDIENLTPPEKEAYHLGSTKHNNFEFKVRPEWGIEKNSITQISVSRTVLRETRSLTIKCGSYPNAIYEELDIFVPYQSYDTRPSRNFVEVDRIQVRTEFMQQLGKKGKNQRTFYITKDGCDLKYDGRDLILRNMLIDSGLEEREMKANCDASQSVPEPA